jgi:hypothetical protein
MEYPFLPFCKKVADLSPNIQAVILTSEGRLAGSYSRKGFLLPIEKRLSAILIQAEIMMSIPISNEDYFGKVNHVMIDHSGVHNLLFPVRGMGVLGVAIVPPYPREDIIAKISSVLADISVLDCGVKDRIDDGT